MGVCYEFRYEYGDYAERWCKAPPAGEFVDTYLHKGKIMVTYYDYDRRRRRAQPPAGWGCPTD